MPQDQNHDDKHEHEARPCPQPDPEHQAADLARHGSPSRNRAHDPDHAAAASDKVEPLPLSVWVCAQRPAVWQRRGRYLPVATANPAKMLPALAATAIASYTKPGDLVLDPMCGIGTTLVEAVHLDRTAIGIECEARWANLARANLDLARDHGAPGTGAVITGDARNASALMTDPHVVGNVALLLTSPPYGQSTHGQVRSSRETGHTSVRKYDYAYGKNRSNLARGSHDRLLSGFTDILLGCVPLLRPGGIVAITTRPFRRHGHLIDFPNQVWAAAQNAGLEPLQRLVALLCGIKADHLVTRASFFAMHETRKARAAGVPLHVNAHEEVLILRRPPGPQLPVADGEPTRSAENQ
ncbi:site-specific DNA-methyltransferase [Actinoallomurus sp. NBC_01490]|uniref:TRM11 family SAM-dependent methyltransferase n=1 Tax=Actinoallomurus sp. NBC_01490 TaxID=2903557 RepID=UPI002E3055EC|nr:DNA methyltransferase [Actinoallomurus sp. NBC_01490]